MYAALLDNRAPCIWRFLLSHPLDAFCKSIRNKGNGLGGFIEMTPHLC